MMEKHDAQQPVIYIRDLHKSYYIGEIEVPAPGAGALSKWSELSL